jgi:hypothetical protein
MTKGTVIIIGSRSVLEPAVARLKEKKYSVIGIEQWPQGDYLQMPMYCIEPVGSGFPQK